jgi:Tol biopolymer transport system component/serine/threonine protein kinase
MPLNSGQVLVERYRIEALLGQGGMGAVYRAIDLQFNTPVAIKENLEVTPEAQRQFSREAGILHHLCHPNLPRVTDYFTVAGQGQYLVMDYVEGQDLHQLLAGQGPVPQAQALAWIGQVLDALDYLHGVEPQPIIHRDVKPANVKITPQGQVYLVDFGLAKVYDPHKGTTIGARGVTPGFAPPEQYGQGRTDPRTDLYSVGATLYALLTGQSPPDALDLITGQAVLRAPRDLDPAISPHVDAAVLWAMHTRPSQRPQSVVGFRQALLEPGTRLLPDRQSPPLSGAAALPTPGRRYPAWLWPAAGGVVALLVILAIVAAVLSGRGDGNGTTPPATEQTIVVVITNAPSPSVTPARTASPSLPPGTEAAPTVEESPAPSPAATRPSPTPTPAPATAASSPTSLPEPTSTTAPPTPLPPTPTAVPAPTGTATAPPPLPRIAFMSDRTGNDEIWVMNADGSQAANLTNHPAADYGPAWSPDGRRIAFGSDRDGSWDLYVMNSDGSGLARVTTGAAFDHMPSWSADGSRLAFMSDRDGNLEIYAVNVGGGGLARLTNDPAVDVLPAWSPAGGQIAFQSGRSGNDEIWVMNADGSGARNLTNHPAPDWGPAWSPDGRRIAFESEREDSWDIFVVNADGSGLARLTTSPATDQKPAWSADGRRITFMSDRDGNPEIYVMNADGRGQTRLTNQPGRDESPHWAPR